MSVLGKYDEFASAEEATCALNKDWDTVVNEKKELLGELLQEIEKLYDGQDGQFKFTTELESLILSKIESEPVEEMIKESKQVQRAVINLSIYFYGKKLMVADLLQMFQFDANEEKGEFMVKKEHLENLLFHLYWWGVADGECKNHFLIKHYCRLLHELILPSTYFGKVTKDQQKITMEEHMFSEYCLEMSNLSEAIMSFGSVGERLWKVFDADPANNEYRVIAILDLFRGVVHLLPSDGFDFRAFLGVGDFLKSFCIQYIKQAWEKNIFKTDSNTVEEWQELLDYETSSFYYYNSEKTLTRWTRPTMFYSQDSLWRKGFTSAMKLVLSMSYVPAVRSEIFQNDITKDTICKKSLRIKEGSFHREIAWVLLVNVACCFETVHDRKILKHIERIRKFFNDLSVSERARIVSAFMEQSRCLPTHDPTDSELYLTMYEALVKPRSKDEDPNEWIFCCDLETGYNFFSRIVGNVSVWERPCVLACAWNERHDDEGNVFYEHFTGKTQWEYPEIALNEGDEDDEDEDDGLMILGDLPMLKPPKTRQGKRQRTPVITQQSTQHILKRAPSIRPSKPPNPWLYSPFQQSPLETLAEDAESKCEKDLEKEELQNVPDQFKCALTKHIMTEPVVSPQGHVFERKAIEKYLQENEQQKCPISNCALTVQDLRPQKTIRNEILLFHIRGAVGPHQDQIELYKV